jgi:hypothetical protein
MKQKSARSVKKTISNAFGSLGYLFCVLQCFWTIMLYFSVIQPFILFISSTDSKQAEHTPSFTFTLPGPVQAAILIAVTVIMVAITVYALVRIPMAIVKTSNKAVYKTTAAVVPVVIKAQHKKDTPAVRRRLTSKVVLVLKVLLVIIPAVLTATSGLLEKQSIDYSIAVIVGCGLACLSLIFFTIQYVLAGLLRVKSTDLW